MDKLKRVQLPDLKNILFIVLAVLVFYLILYSSFSGLSSFLPSPSILLGAIPALIIDYHFLFHLSYTLTILLISLVFPLLLLYFTGGWIIMAFYKSRLFSSLIFVLNYFPAFITALLFISWYPDSWIAELVFAIIFSSVSYIMHLRTILERLPESYNRYAVTHGITGKNLYHNYLIKLIFPEIVDSSIRIHRILWVIIVVYEFVLNYKGLGSIYYQATYFKDVTVIMLLAVILAVFIGVFELLLILAGKRIINWER